MLPSSKLYKFRLDFGRFPKKVKISNLKLVGNKKIQIDDFNLFSFSKDIEKYDINDATLTIQSNKKDPYIMHKKGITLKGRYIIDWHILIILTVISFLFSYKIIKWLAKFKILELRSRIDIVFLAFLAVCLYLPMSNISKLEKSTQENRMLAKKPLLFSDNKINVKYGEQFEKWFNDRFFGRDLLINLVNWLNFKINPTLGNTKVLVGLNKWLFYRGDNNIENYANITKLTPKEMAKGLKYIRDLNNWCQKHNKKFYFVIVPDKNKIYGEHFTQIKKVNPDTEGIGWQFYNYLTKHSDLNAIYLYDTLMRHKKEGLLFYKSDTHWNKLGAYYGYQTIIENISKDFSIPSILDISWQTENLKKGDLAAMYKLYDGDNSQYKIPQFKKNISCSNQKKYNRESGIVECKNPSKVYKVFVLRDSFSTNLIDYYAQTFSFVQLHWKKAIDYDDLDNIQKNFDIIILETVERYIPQLFQLNFPKD